MYSLPAISLTLGMHDCLFGSMKPNWMSRRALANNSYLISFVVYIPESVYNYHHDGSCNTWQNFFNSDYKRTADHPRDQTSSITKSQSNQFLIRNYRSWTSHQINMSYKSLSLLFIAAAVLFAATSAIPAPALRKKMLLHVLIIVWAHEQFVGS